MSLSEYLYEGAVYLVLFMVLLAAFLKKPPSGAPVPVPRRPPLSPQMSEELAISLIGTCRQLGFFSRYQGLSDADVLQNLAARHGDSIRQIDSELEMAQSDESRFLYIYLKDADPTEEKYVDELREWAKISRGAFKPLRPQEAWESESGPVLLRFSLGGHRHILRLRSGGGYLDLAGMLLGINQLIAPGGSQFEALEVVNDDSADLLLLTPAEKARLVERGWRFLERCPLTGEPLYGAAAPNPLLHGEDEAAAERVFARQRTRRTPEKIAAERRQNAWALEGSLREHVAQMVHLSETNPPQDSRHVGAFSVCSDVARFELAGDRKGTEVAERFRTGLRCLLRSSEPIDTAHHGYDALQDAVLGRDRELFLQVAARLTDASGWDLRFNGERHHLCRLLQALVTGAGEAREHREALRHGRTHAVSYARMLGAILDADAEAFHKAAKAYLSWFRREVRRGSSGFYINLAAIEVLVCLLLARERGLAFSVDDPHVPLSALE